MDYSEEITGALLQLYNTMKDRYGDEVETFWFYASETCPCCNKRKIDRVKTGEESLISLNGFMYHDMNVLIGYFLCSHCIATLPGTSKKQKEMYAILELKLKEEYHVYLKSIAS